MDSHHTGSDELVYVQTQGLILTIKGQASHPSFPGVQFKEKESTLRISCDDDFDVTLVGDYNVTSYTNLSNSYSREFLMQPVFFEQQRYEIVIEGLNGHEVEFWHDNYNIRRNVTKTGHNDKCTLMTGVLNFGNDIGYSDLVIRLDGRDYLRIIIEVYPSKISYREDYKSIVSDVTAEVYNLIFDFLKKTYDSFSVSSSQHSSPVEFFAIIRKIYGEFMKAADVILQSPHHILQTEHRVTAGYKVKRMDTQTLRWVEKHPDKCVRRGDRLLVSRALAVNKYVTYDTKENRLTKYMLKTTARRLDFFKKQYNRLSRENDPEIIRQIDVMIQGIQRRCNTGFLRCVDAVPAKSGMSLVFGMAPGYRELYRCYLLLQHGLTVTGSIFNVSVKDLAVLYEYWCFIKLNSLMKERYELVSQDIIKISGSGLFVSLIKGQRSTVRYRNPVNGELITLSYNPKEINVPTVTQRPDNVLRLEKHGSETDYEYVFDAKYRVNPALPGTDYYKMISETPGPEISDINTMHRYRDAIVYQNEASPYERTMFGAYVLFPYCNEDEYSHHRFYRSIDQVNIGGLPFLPSATSLVTEMLDNLISDSSDSAFERATLPRGIESRLAKVNWKERDVLVGTLQNRKQLKICLEYKFYHVLVSRIETDQLPVRYVALYQSKAIFGTAARIEYYGEVISTEVVNRRDITEIPKDSNELCYRFRIKKWKKLARPIEPKERGFVRMFTNLFLLEHSSQVPELFLQTEEEYRFYMELKHRTKAEVINDEASNSGFTFGDYSVLFDNGEILLFEQERIRKKVSINDFARKPGTVFRNLTDNLFIHEI